MSQNIRKTALIVVGATFFTLLCNAPLLILGNHVFFQRAMINIDYSIAAALALLMRSPTLLGVTLPILFGLDIAFSFSPAYHFSPQSTAQALADLGKVSPVYLIVLFIIFLAYVFFAVWMALIIISECTKQFKNKKNAAIFAATLLIIAVTAAWQDHKSVRQQSPDVRDDDSNFASSTTNNLYTALKTYHASQEIQSSVDSSSQPNVLDTWPGFDESQPSSVLLIMVESLGLPTDPELNQFQLEHLLDLGHLDNISIHQGSTSFNGSTVPGELRELCSIQVTTLRPDLSATASRCLPERFKSMGYHTTAIHGFVGSMFSRNIWYEQLGFHDVFFAADLTINNPQTKRCGVAFNGICDNEVWNFIIARESTMAGKPRFTYWLTLSAHLPLGPDETTREQARRDCSRYEALTDNLPVCLLLHQHRVLFSRIAQSVSSGHFSDTVIILVGDHAPPFIQQRYRQRFSDNQVPFVVIDIAPDHPPDAKEQPFHE